MALQFTTDIKTPQGIVISNAYGRVAAADQISGAKVDGLVEVFVNETEYLAGAQAINVPFRKTASVAYDRTTDGTDVLDIAHDALIAALAEQGITATKSL